MTKRRFQVLSSGVIVALTAALAVTGYAQAPAPRPAPPATGAPTVPASAAAAIPSASAGAKPASSAAPSGSAAPSSSAFNGLAPPTVKPVAAYVAPAVRKTAPPAPPPTPEQLAALAALKVEADVYAKGAQDYSDTVTNIVRFHYQEKKKEILTGLDKDIAIERIELKKARDVAIQRLEEFVAKYSGVHAQPEATPDAM